MTSELSQLDPRHASRGVVPFAATCRRACVFVAAFVLVLSPGCQQAPRREEQPWAPLPAVARPWFDRAERHRAAGRTDRAISEYRRVLSEEPAHIPSHWHYQDLMREEGRGAEVHEEYRLRLQDRGGPLEWCLLGRLETNPTLREFRFRRALELDPAFPWAHIALAGLLRDTGQVGLALEHQEYALERMPDYLEGYLDLADLYRESGRWEDAIEAYEFYLGQVPGDFYARECIAGCRLRGGDSDGAREAYRAILADRPSHVESHLGLAAIALVERRRNEAAGHLEEARKLAPGQPEVYFNLGILAEELDRDLETALGHYREYLAADGERKFRANLRIQRIEREIAEREAKR